MKSTLHATTYMQQTFAYFLVMTASTVDIFMPQEDRLFCAHAHESLVAQCTVDLDEDLEAEWSLLQLQAVVQQCLKTSAAPAPPLETLKTAPGTQVVQVVEHPKSVIMGLPFHVFGDVFSFVPLRSLSEAATVCSSWAAVARFAVEETEKRAEQYVHEGLLRMATTNSPWESLDKFQTAIAVFPRMIKAYYWAAKAFLILSDCEGAIRTMDRALQQRPSRVESLKLQACILYTYGDDRHASELLEEALRLEPNDATIHFELGFCYQGLREFAKAIDCYAAALRLNYTRAFVALANRADCWYHSNKMEEALEDLTASLLICPHYPLALRIRAIVNEHLGDSHAAHKDYTTIIETATDPKVQSDAYCDRAVCFGDVDVDDIEQAHRIYPNDLKPVQFKASALVNDGRVDEAITYVSEWMAGTTANADRASQYAFRGELYSIIRDWKASIRDYEKAIELTEHGKIPEYPDYCDDYNARETVSAYFERLEELKAEQLLEEQPPRFSLASPTGNDFWGHSN